MAKSSVSVEFTGDAAPLSRAAKDAEKAIGKLDDAVGKVDGKGISKLDGAIGDLARAAAGRVAARPARRRRAVHGWSARVLL